MKIVFVLLFFCLIEPLHACVCFDIDSVSAKDLIDEVEFVIIGRAVKNVGFNEEVNGMWDQSNRGFDVLFEVDSVLKGNIHSRKLFVKQFGGNCDRIFEFGERYIIVGNGIDEFVQGDKQTGVSNKEGISNTDAPPPPPSINSKTVTFYNGDKREIKYWNNLADYKVILNTSSCSSFFVDSEIAGYFLSK